MTLFVSKSRMRIALLIAATLAAGSAAADSATAQKFFDNGNAAFQQGHYEAALANYGDALAHGKDGPRLFYNMGLTHYRLGQYSQARQAFHESAKDDALAALSYYQLGALAEHDGNDAEAADWFRRARNRARSDRLRRQSTRALTVIGAAQPVFESGVSAGFGYDSNAFRSPDTPYVDISQLIPTPVTPVPQSGAYVPVRIRADYSKATSRRSSLLVSYRFRGDYHTDAALQNADETNHRLSLGGERRIGRRSENRRIEYAAIYRRRTEANFDRDDGLDRFDDGESIVDRFNYQSFGAEAEMKSRIGRVRVGLNGGLEHRDYDDVPTASSYDMTMYRIGADARFPMSDNARLKLGYQHYARDYDERRSKDITGDASTANPTLEYRYNVFEAGVRQRLGDRAVAEIIYSYTIREDQFAAYNDYTKNKIRLETEFEITDRLGAGIGLVYRDQEYPNAFAFDDPSQPQKEYQELEIVADVDFRITERLSIQADIRQEAVESSDPRGEYDRTRAAIGLFWEF